MPARILVVDDHAPTCELICEILRSGGMEATSLTDSAEAAQRLQREKYHAVFLDMRMPPPDGVELARQIRASRANASTVIVMITGEEDRTLMARAFEAGVELFLFKPVERNKLLKLMRVAEGPIERERRRFTRVKVRRGVSIESDGQPVKGTTLDLSMGGMLVQASYIFPLGSAVRVNLELKPGTSPLLLTARVVRMSGDDCMGLEFHNVAPKEGNALQEFLLPLIVAG